MEKQCNCRLLPLGGTCNGIGQCAMLATVCI
jgi:hypothetical protein